MIKPSQKPTNTPRIKDSSKYIWLVGLLLANVMIPLIFVWIVEITLEPRQDIIATNGFWNTDVLKLYHMGMYFLITTTFTTSLIILTKLIREKQ